MLGDTDDRISYLAQRVDPGSKADKTAFARTLLALALVIDPERGEGLLEDYRETRGTSYAYDADRLVEALGEILSVNNITHTPFDKFLPWVYRAFRDGPAIEAVADFLRDLPTWQAATKIDLGRLTFKDAVLAQNAWQEADQAKRVVYAFDDGWRVIKLTRRRELEDEGMCMEHCVGQGDYYKKVRAGDAVIFSLRNAQNAPQVTLEWSPETKRFVQIKGPENAEPAPEFQPYLVEFVENVFDGEPIGLLLTGVSAKDLDLRGTDLTATDLSGMDLRGANLSGANLTNADLTNTKLGGADLTNAELGGVNLRGANLRGANLSGANLANADLTDANLREASLPHANLHDANLHGANLSGANLRDANLRGAGLGYAKLDSANLTGADLFSTNLTFTNLTNANLTDTRLSDADLTGASLHGANLRGADLYRANLFGAGLTNVSLSNANLSQADLSHANLRGADLSGVDLSGANLFGVDLTSMVFDEKTIMPDGNYWRRLAVGLGRYRKY